MSQVQTKSRINSLVSRQLGTDADNIDVASLLELCDTVRRGYGNDVLNAIKEPFKHGAPPIQMKTLELLDGLLQNTTPDFAVTMSSEEWTERYFRTAKTATSPVVCDRIITLSIQWALTYPTMGMRRLVDRFAKSKVLGDRFAAMRQEEVVRQNQRKEQRRLQQQQQQSAQFGGSQNFGGSQASFDRPVTHHRDPSTGNFNQSSSMAGSPQQQPRYGYNAAPVAAVPQQQTSQQFEMQRQRSAILSNIDTFLLEAQGDAASLEYGIEHPDMLEEGMVKECDNHRHKAASFLEKGDQISDEARDYLTLLLEQLHNLLQIHDAIFGTTYVGSSEYAAPDAVTPRPRDDDDDDAEPVDFGGGDQPLVGAPPPSTVQLPPNPHLQQRKAQQQQQPVVSPEDIAEKKRLTEQVESDKKEIAELKAEKDALLLQKNEMQDKYKDAKAKNKKAVEAVNELEDEINVKEERIAELTSALSAKTNVPPPKPEVREVVKVVKPVVPAKTLRILNDTVSQLRAEIAGLRTEGLRIRTVSDDFAATFGASVESHITQFLSSQLQDKAKDARALTQLQDLYKREMKLRKNYYNQIQELKGNLRVYCRVRPMSKKEISNGHKEVTDFVGDDAVRIVDERDKVKMFEFDTVFQPDSSQEAVFADTCPLIDSVVDGFNVCIFAYGQTGTGKTHTMSGSAADPGINRRALDRLFQVIAEREATEASTVSVSVLEIYNEKIRDLLVPDIEAAKMSFEIRTGGQFGHSVTNLTEQAVATSTDIEKIMDTATLHRKVTATNMNDVSSRSHMIVYIRINTVNNQTKAQSYGKLSLVDLAGSERLDKSGAEGQAAKEAMAINKSLTALGDTISALGAGAKHVPYRNSMLTHLLQDSMAGQAKVLMFCCVSPASYNISETLSSLMFATRARGVSLGQVKKNTA
jgi:kinesin family protein C2/C3